MKDPRLISHPRAGQLRLAGVGLMAGLLLQGAIASALEHGHLRARTRAFVYEGEFGMDGAPSPSMEFDIEDGEEVLEEEVAVSGTEDPVDLTETTWEEPAAVEEEVEETVELEHFSGPRKSPSQRVHRWVKDGAGMLLIGDSPFGKKAFKAEGYLAFGPPKALRFSDADEVNRRPPSPALPEFSFSSEEYFPYLVETPLEEGAFGDASMLSELVIELEPHTVVSGKIDTRRIVEEETVESFDLEEQRSTVLRPEEVLIFFETDGSMTETNAVIPFSPATPNNQTPKSSAKLIKE
ncbi:hypothetical protein [Pelagicoccus sp. SDUM812003]|uniref:hypothetical protein n=1 Tax=Pelagicoccus sp. SDUM812003 TaxID=3041267 RepID=UPI00280E37C1|nr:hypothetical protein [Pelagicoccus sp. SDUM812003]MDQ8201580.1 hypothetical protein [Pelagicoccus sp. SDUM812003]